MIWVLIFVIANSSFDKSSGASVVVDFSSKEACMAAQSALLEQARQKNKHVMAHMCIRK